MTPNYLHNRMYTNSAPNFIIAFAVFYNSTRLIYKKYFNLRQITN